MEIRIRLRDDKAQGRQSVPLNVSLLRYSYDADAKRARQVVIGSAPFWADELPADLVEKLTPDELGDWRAFVYDRHSQEMAALRRWSLQHAVQILAYASQALQADVKPSSPALARKAAKLFLQTLDMAGYSEEKAKPGRPRRDLELDAAYLLLTKPEDIERFDVQRDGYATEDESITLPQFAPPLPERKRFPEYPNGDLIAHALRLAFVDGEGSGSND